MAANYARAVVDELAAARPSLADRQLLLHLYALLALAKGRAATLKDVHDAWALWSDVVNPTHKDLVPFDQLSADIQAYDARYRDLIHASAPTEKVTIIGSVRYPDLLVDAAAVETAAGNFVVAIPVWDDRLDEDVAVVAYLPFVEQADTVVVVPRPDGTLGPWSMRELAHAAARGKRVRLLTPAAAEVAA